MTSEKFVSIVIPVLNEADSIRQLHEEIVKVCTEENYNYEIIIVDDGSIDGTDQVLINLSPLTYIRLRRNFGQTAALDCGIKQAHGELIVTMDGDGQNDPADIPRMIHYLTKYNLDIVSGWRKHRKDSLLKKFSSRLANILRGFILHDGLNDSGCSLKVYRSECFEGINLYGEIHRFIPALLKVKGFKIGEIVVNHRPRSAGRTKYTWTRGIKGLIDMISVWFWHKYAVRPLHLLGGIGLLCILAGLIVSAIGIGFYFANISLFRFFLPVLSSLLLMTGTQIFLIGLIADILSKDYFASSPDVPYNVKEIIEN
ncbi:MAG: glycosyltransferase family 2 protein [Candidatus Helarchaeota archaeon]